MKEKERYELIGYCSYRDTETGVIGDNFVELLNQKDKRIKELESKLAKRTEQLKIALKDFNDIQEENDKLSQQLHSQPAEIVKKIKKRLCDRLNIIAGYGQMTTDEFSFFVESEFTKDIDEILKEYGEEK